jgi:HAE1 family hydrophobic/amphiphilic exporter-1
MRSWCSEHLQVQGREEPHPIEAAIQGTRDIGLAVMATTLSRSSSVCRPLRCIGRLLSFDTAAFAIMVSLLVVLLTPMLARVLLRCGGLLHQGHLAFRMMSRPYRAMLHWSMAHRWVIVAVCVAVTLSSVPLFLLIGKSFLPTDDQSEFEVIVKLAPGSSLEGTDAVMSQVEAEIKALPGVRNMLTTVGADVRRQVDRVR